MGRRRRAGNGVQAKLPADSVVEIDLGCGLEEHHDTPHGHEGVHNYRVCGPVSKMARANYVCDWTVDSKSAHTLFHYPRCFSVFSLHLELLHSKRDL
jgi:hypothetical protein